MGRSRALVDGLPLQAVWNARYCLIGYAIWREPPTIWSESSTTGRPREKSYRGAPRGRPLASSGCSELRAQIDAGKLKPNVTVQSFIEQDSVWGFQGDDRGFLDSPASADSLNFRLHASLTYGSDRPTVVGGVSSFGPIYVGGPAGSGAVGGPAFISRQSRPGGDGSVTRSGYSFSFNYDAAGSDGLFFGAAPNAIQRGSISVNYETGSYLGVLTHTDYPAAQVFLDGSSIYNYSSDQFDKGPLDLGEGNLRTSIVAGMACDPSR